MNQFLYNAACSLKQKRNMLLQLSQVYQVIAFNLKTIEWVTRLKWPRNILLCVENSEKCSILKQNLLLNNTFRMNQHFKIMFTVFVMSSPNCKASVRAIICMVFGDEVSSTPKLIPGLEKGTCSLFFKTRMI